MFWSQSFERNECMGNVRPVKYPHQDEKSKPNYTSKYAAGLTSEMVSSNRMLNSCKTVVAHLLTSTSKHNHINSTLRSMHWLPVAQRTDFKTALFGYKSLNGLVPKHICDMSAPYNSPSSENFPGGCEVTVSGWVIDRAHTGLPQAQEKLFSHINRTCKTGVSCKPLIYMKDNFQLHWH